jgi:hypothetical protein
VTERFIVQRALTKDILTREAQVESKGDQSRQLSAVGTLQLVVTPGVATQIASDGLPLFVEWNSIVTVEVDGDLPFRGLVTDMTYDGPNWTIDIRSMATYSYGTPWEGSPYYGAKVDPADIVRKLWAHVQSFPDSDLGVTVRGTTPVRVGSFSTQNKADTLAVYNAATARYNAQTSALSKLRAVVAASRKAYSGYVDARTAASKALTAAKKTKNKDKIAAAQAAYNQRVADCVTQQGIIDRQQGDVDAQVKVVAAAKAVKDDAYKDKVAAGKAVKDDGGAFTLLWWEAPDCGRTIDDLTKSTPFDWYERHYWKGDVPATEIVIAFPRMGRRLGNEGDPTFVQGVNIMVPIVPKTSGDDFANVVYGVGAGEGIGSIRRSITQRNGKLRRVAAFQAKDVKVAATLDTKLRAELVARQNTLVVDSVTVLNHVNSPRGSYGIGDDILIQGDVPHYGEFSLWHRILSITDKTDGTSELALARTDSFTYGKGISE